MALSYSDNSSKITVLFPVNTPFHYPTHVSKACIQPHSLCFVLTPKDNPLAGPVVTEQTQTLQ